MRASPPLTHPTQHLPDSRFPIPDSRFPIPVPLLGGVRGGFRFPIPDSRFPIPVPLLGAGLIHCDERKLGGPETRVNYQSDLNMEL
ncbi:hypothetical protein [Moorena producens]|uniref:hypothetical protein n=1 Tax=Moorena producens TaxID=1155739 RepID=UPI003C7201B5